MQANDGMFFIDTVTGPNYIVPAPDSDAAKQMMRDRGVQFVKCVPMDRQIFGDDRSNVDVWVLP